MILRKALFSELPVIWGILQQAIEQRKEDGSDQWQNGYPNEQTVHDDISKGYGYVLIDNNVILVYGAIIFDRLGYTYCGEIFISGASRRAYEKVIPRI